LSFYYQINIYYMNTKSLVRVGLISLSLMLLAAPALAQLDWGLNYAVNVGLGTREVRDVAVSVIQTLLGILGILALVIILYGGFRWMTAAGNEDNVATAKKIMVAGVIGLVVIFFAYAIVAFVFNVVGGSL
jgi:multidrug transporter EmrE-like cation transporter